jgi:hypothetical protein
VREKVPFSHPPAVTAGNCDKLVEGGERRHAIRAALLVDFVETLAFEYF